MIRALIFSVGLMALVVQALAQATPTTTTSYEEAVAMYEDGNYADALPLAQTYAAKGDANQGVVL